MQFQAKSVQPLGRNIRGDLVHLQLAAVLTKRGTIHDSARKVRPDQLRATVEGHAGPSLRPKEEYKIFDNVSISVRAGNGGCGEIIQEGKGKLVKNLKYHSGAQQKKQIWLNAGNPGPGVDGGHVVLFCSSSVDTLSHLHERKVYTAKSGTNANPETGSQAPKRLKHERKRASNLRIPVPPGTVVKRKSGKYVGELVEVGEELVVAQGGVGGHGVVQPSRKMKATGRRQARRLRNSGVEVIEIEDDNWKEDTFGSPGEEAILHLILRIVADVGFVGLPNAGKSSLLAGLTRAKPEIASYPFTTLIPNLGVMSGGIDPVLVDLPGLIEGAHVGRGLGRNFLRHLRRTRALLQVIDCSTEDPVADFITIREELRMYNPEYCSRPFVVALNKMDLPEALSRRKDIIEGIHAAAAEEQIRNDSSVLPNAVLPVSALTMEGLEEIQQNIDVMVRLTDEEYQDESQLLKASNDLLSEMASSGEIEPWE